MTGAAEDINHPWLRPCDDLRTQSRRSVLELFLMHRSESIYRYFSLNTAVWCVTCPATTYAHALTVNGLPLATPFRVQASSGRFRKNEIVASRTSRNSSTCRAQETASE